MYIVINQENFDPEFNSMWGPFRSWADADDFRRRNMPKDGVIYELTDPALAVPEDDEES